ncbi:MULTISPECIES: Gp19/Gp15/Gp42 family protein [Corynebacterium]|uniref:Gp19/Gp15/Gp42 family protein n=1 Tax=Corynebacterium TaxID=1716 RepID=UPI00124D31C9|nr:MULTISPECIES: Gp19/Gp15/Gp42 family protein [Corynebacterium]
MFFNPSDIECRLPRSLSEAEKQRLAVLVGDAEELIAAAFTREGRDFYVEVEAEWLQANARRVVLEMVSSAILVGGDAGKRQSSITVGGVTESSTWADVSSAPWGVLSLSDSQRRLLGLAVAVKPRVCAPAAKCWPERW